jgi:hypothetical protein
VTTNELLIGVGGLVLSVLTYFGGVWRTERRHRADDRAARIRRVFDKYMEFRRSNYTGGYDGLVKAGLATLVSTRRLRTYWFLSRRMAKRIPWAQTAMRYFGTSIY